MFYSEFILTKSGELAKFWLAAHLKIKKQDIKNTDIKKEIEFIKNPKVPLALRTTGHLLVGVVRIYQSKLALLEKEARLLILKMEKTPYTVSVMGIVGKPTKGGAVSTIAKYNSITLAPKMTEIDLLFAMPKEMDITSGGQFVSAIDQITKQDVEGYDGWHVAKESQQSASMPSIGQPIGIMRPSLTGHMPTIEDREGMQISEPVDLAGTGLEMPAGPEGAERIAGQEQDEEQEFQAFVPAAEFGNEEEEQGLGPFAGDKLSVGTEAGSKRPSEEQQKTEEKRGIKRSRAFAGLLIDEETELSTDTIRTHIATTTDIVADKKLLAAPSTSTAAQLVSREPEDFDEFLAAPTSFEDQLPPQLMDLWNDVMGRARIFSEEEKRSTKRRKKETDEEKRKREISEEEKKRRETEEERLRRLSEEEEAPFIPPEGEDFAGPAEFGREDELPGKEAPLGKISGIGVDDIEEMFLQRRASSMRKSEEGKLPEEEVAVGRISTEENVYMDQAKKELTEEETKLTEKYKGTGITDKTIKCFMVVEEAMKEKEKVSLNTLLSGRKRETAAKFFFECLVMKSKKLIDVQQEDPEGEIFIGKPNAF